MGKDERLPDICCQTYLFLLIPDPYPHIHSPYDYDDLKILNLKYVNKFKHLCNKLKT
jgi:hypothetical protein